MTMEPNVSRVPRLVARLYQVVRELTELFPGRRFTPDGHLVGSIGEVIAEYTYGLTLENCSNPGFDARTRTGQTVEIKLTGGTSVAVASDGNPPALLIVLRLDPKTGFTEIYNGEFPVELRKAKPKNKRNVVTLRLSELRRLAPTQVIPLVHSLDEINRLFSPH